MSSIVLQIFFYINGCLLGCNATLYSTRYFLKSSSGIKQASLLFYNFISVVHSITLFTNSKLFTYFVIPSSSTFVQEASLAFSSVNSNLYYSLYNTPPISTTPIPTPSLPLPTNLAIYLRAKMPYISHLN